MPGPAASIGDRPRHRIPMRARSPVRALASGLVQASPRRQHSICGESPKKYQDIYPFDFETDDWPALWAELKSVIEFWIEEGVRYSGSTIRTPRRFRSGSGHPRDPARNPDAIFLAEPSHARR